MLVVAVAGCPKPPAAPEDYGKALRACEVASATAAEYTACCTAVAGRFGRDSAFCDLGDLDGGAE